MANDITLNVKLKTQMDELDKIKGNSHVKLSKKQQEAYDINKKGAETALAAGDLKGFRNYFNRMSEILQKATITSGQISKNLQDLTKRQEEINKDIQALKEKRDELKKSITSSKGEGTLSKTKANELLSEFKDKDKIVGKTGTPLKEASAVNSRVQKLAQELQAAGKTWSQITNEMAQKAGFKDKNSAQAAHRFYEGEQKYIIDAQKEISNIDTQITSKETTQTNLSAEIEKIRTASPGAAQALEQLYVTISKIKNTTNTTITQGQSDQRKAEAAAQPGAGVGTENLAEGVKKETSSLGKAFKQFTLYHMALRAVKSALREAVQTVKELDKELTEQAMVTGLTREQTYGLVKSYQDLALQTGATTKEIAGVATEYMKQGKSIQDSMVLTEAAVSAAKVARVSTADSVNYLTTALNGFQLAAEDAMKVSDKFAAVAAASASDYDELAIALSKVASQANLAGMSIDYTTALLTKGLETTREAPETMGTALKTIIARMREISDYGETLDGETDVNNVESQLAYVGIELRNTAGELRSTEDVLDELGKKWDTLNKNQQAAVAKALAGTRQQSRLIALMTDYERVTELQEISQRSAGATAAQAGVYLEGIEASMNKITVAWEKIVTSITDSEFIIGVLEGVGNLLDNIGSALENETASMFILIPLGAAMVTMLTHKYETQKRINRAAIQEVKEKRDQTILEKTSLLNQKKSLLFQLKELRGDKMSTKELAKQALLDEDKTNDALAQKFLTEAKKNELKDEVALNTEIAALEKDIQLEELAIRDLKYQQAQSSLEELQNQSGILSIFGSILSILTPVFMMMQLINGAQALFIKLKKKEVGASAAAATAAGTEAAVKTTGMFAGIVKAFSQGGIPGVIAGIVLATALAAALGVAIAASVGAFSDKTETDKAAEEVNELSNEIYKLQEKANAINQITTSFEALDNKIIKTKKDMEEMNSLLDQAADKLSDQTFESEKEAQEAGEVYYGKDTSEKDAYEALLTDNQRLEFLEASEEHARETGAQKRREQIEIFKDNSELLNEKTSDAQIKKAQTAIYANAVYNLQDYIDEIKEINEDFSAETAAAVEEMTQNILEESDLSTALDFADNPEKVKALVDEVKDLEIAIKDADGEMQNISTAKILTSDDYGITQKAKAFRELEQQLGSFSEEFQLLEQAYSEYALFADMSDDVLEMIDYLEISIDDINQLGASWERLKEAGLDISQDTFKNLITDNEGGLLDTLAKTGGNVKSTIDQVFGAYLMRITDPEQYETAYQAIVKSFSDLLGIGTLNMGQNIEKLENQVNSFYEKAAEWKELSESEKTEFMTDHAGLFTENDDLLEALENNDWVRIQEILSESDVLQEQIDKELKHIETELALQEALGDEADANYTKWLKDRKAELLNQTEFFRADLELLLDQEQQQLDIYRDYLEKQQEQLEESLDQRKEAYEKYFEAINQQMEDEDYQEQSDLLVANLSKLASSTDFASQKQARELEQQLEELEKERQDELRQRAQDAVIESIDSQVEEINEKFEKLLDNEQLLLEAMTGEISTNPNFLAQLLASARENGMTDLQLEEYSNELISAFGNLDIGTDNIQEIIEQINNNATINIGNQTFDLDTEDGDVVWQTLLAMLTKYGYGR